MKFVITYTQRSGGTAAENVAAAEAGQKLLSNWQPNPTGTILQWVQRCDGNGGFAVTEGEEAGPMLKDLSTWSPWFEFQVYPVVDILEASPITDEALSIAKSVL